jgi:hypothetical protein
MWLVWVQLVWLDGWLGLVGRSLWLIVWFGRGGSVGLVGCLVGLLFGRRSVWFGFILFLGWGETDSTRHPGHYWTSYTTLE